MTATTNGASIEHRIGAEGAFHLRQLSGSVRLRGVEGDVARVRDRNGRSLADSFQIEATEGRLSLSAPDRFGLDLVLGFGRRSSMDLEIEVPRGATVSLETASAEIEAGDLLGDTKVRTASGDVTLERMGGALELDAVSGDVAITAQLPMTLRARTISGDCAIRAPRLGRATVESTSGDVRIDAVLGGDGPFSISTVSGDATIVGRTGLRVEARTVTGDLRSDLPHRREQANGRKVLVVGDGSVAISFRSVSGDLRVTAPRDTLPVGATGVPAVAGTMPSAPQAPLAPIAPDAPVAPLAPVPPQVSSRPEDRNAGGREVARLDILHALERGELSVEVAMQRLAEIEEA